jgi:hypothetical protein
MPKVHNIIIIVIIITSIVVVVVVVVVVVLLHKFLTHSLSGTKALHLLGMFSCECVSAADETQGAAGEGRERRGAAVEGECEVDCRVLVSVDGGGSLMLQGGDVWFGRCFSTCRSRLHLQ